MATPRRAVSTEDCTIVLDGSSDGKVSPCASPLRGGVPAAAAAAAAATAAGSSATPAGGIVVAAAAPRKQRTYYIDWLRVALTVLVVVHHCVCTYLTSSPWNVKLRTKKDDLPLWLLTELFVAGNQAYFMTLFFFLSGLYVPGSYARKGAWQFLHDRTLRLVVPCLVYSMLVAPLMIWWTAMAATPAPASAAAALRAAFVDWLTPTSWPTRYVLPTGPPWFVWMLWCFNVAYVALRVVGDGPVGRALRCCAPGLARRERTGSRSDAGGRLPDVKHVAGAALPASQQQQQQGSGGGIPGVRAAPWLQYTTAQFVVYGAALSLLLTALVFAVRALDALVFSVLPTTFVSRGPFVAFMPDLFVAYAVAFVLGIQSGPGRWDVLSKLPEGAGWAGGLLLGGGVWWTMAGWVPGIAAKMSLANKLGAGAFLGAWAARTFVEQTFCVAFSAGLLILFRDALNARPSKVGSTIINAAYAAYLVHYPIIAVFARVCMPLAFPSMVLNAAVISPPSVVAAWLVAAALRALPYFDRVL